MSKSTKSLMAKPWLRSLAAPFRSHAVIAISLGLVTACCAALLMFVSGYLICRTAQPGTTLFMIMIPVALVQLFGIGRTFARYFERLVSHDWVFRITSRLRMLLFRAAEDQSDNPSTSHGIGEYLEFVVDDIAHLQNLYLRVSFPAIIAMFMLVIASVFCGVFSLLLGCAFLVFGTVSAIIAPLAARALAVPLQKRAKGRLSNEYARLTDDILGSVDWTLANRIEDVRQAHGRNSSDAFKAAQALRQLVRGTELVSSIIIAAGACVLIVIACGSFQADPGDANLIAAFALGFFPVAETFSLLPHALVDSLNHIDALTRLDAVLENNEDSSRDVGFGNEQSNPFHAVELSGVSYRYPGSKHDAISDLDLVIPVNQKIAILGQSGSGKTTLARLLHGSITPSGGNVFVSGQPASHADDDAPIVGYIPQTPYLFDQTLRDNLLIAKPHASDDELFEVLEQIGLPQKVATLPDGLDTRIGETGTGFSGGEAHRIALARELLADCPIVLLDEPFTSLDPATESKLLDTLLESFAERTLIVITHHLANIERFDRVVFIENGKVEMGGSPHDLARDEPRFKQLLAFDRGISS